MLESVELHGLDSSLILVPDMPQNIVTFIFHRLINSGEEWKTVGDIANINPKHLRMRDVKSLSGKYFAEMQERARTITEQKGRLQQ